MTSVVMDAEDKTGEGAIPSTYADILRAAQKLAPELTARSEEIEKARRLPLDMVEKVRATGAFGMGFSREFGGADLTSAEQTQVLEALSYGDTAVGWCAMVGMDSGLYAAYLQPGAVREVFPSPHMVTSGLINPAGRAERVPGGYRLTGRWAFGSGITHADRVSAGAFTYTDGQQDVVAGGPNWRIMLVSPSDVELIDTWHTTGLGGTGSLDYSITDLFVPEQHTFTFAETPSRSGPLAAPDAIMRKMPGVPIGAARAALDHVREIARTRVDRSTGAPWSEDYRVQTVIGRCEMDFLAMRHAVYSSIDQRWEHLDAGGTLDDLTPDERISCVVLALNAFRTALSIARRLYDLLATTAIYKPSPIDRAVRDLTTMCQHVQAQEVIVQSAGAHLLGGTPRFPFALGLTGF